MLGCEGDGNTGVGSGGGVVAVSAYMGGTGVLSSACDVLKMSVVRGVCGVCDMCMCLGWGGVRGVGVNGCEDWVWALPILGEHGKVGYVSVFWLRWCGCGWCWRGNSGWVACSRVWEGGAGLSLCVLLVWIICVDGRPRYMYIMLGGYLRILGAPIVQSYNTLSIFASYRVFGCGKYRKSSP